MPACASSKAIWISATVYNENPGEQARAFIEMGFSWVHVVDLDGAVAGEHAERGGGRQHPLVRRRSRRRCRSAAASATAPAIDNWLEKGATRVILGTAALHNPELVREAARACPGQIAVGIDARGGKVAIEGWTETSDVTAVDLAKRFEDAGVAAIIYTDIDRDGVLAGINWDATIALANAVAIPVIASGGLASMADIERLARPDAAKLEGAIAGRALYDGRIDPKAALAMLAKVAVG